MKIKIVRENGNVQVTYKAENGEFVPATYTAENGEDTKDNYGILTLETKLHLWYDTIDTIAWKTATLAEIKTAWLARIKTVRAWVQECQALDDEIEFDV